MLSRKTYKKVRKFQGEDGTFLVEAMLCVAILSISLVTVIQGLLSGVQASVESQGYYQAVLLGENAMFTFMREPAIDKILEESQIEEKNGYQVLFKLDWSNNLNADKNLQMAVIEINWHLRNKDKKVLFPTLLLGRSG